MTSAEMAEARTGAERVTFLSPPLMRALMVFFQAGVGANLGVLVEDADREEREVDSVTGSPVSVS